MEVSVIYGNDQGQVTSKETWTSTVLSVSEGYLLDGNNVDWSNPDEGIFFNRLFSVNDTGDIYYFLGEKDQEEVLEQKEGTTNIKHSVKIFSADDLKNALKVLVDGEVVLLRQTPPETAQFKCGLNLVSPQTDE